ncbi:hypothetical protein GALMADRAFT_80309 [Galerina marginata CBS 339.88]|uniref:Homeobox domain-containing protein n=1 Tax=Galerina marginata (strain CBS 339.88) TaxID=685588 RepID=A0A067S7Z0_GALM3|nr:hypothetical protein GALMADRAFT_80309 [Galerina marginata CBS 339.88]
MSKSRSPSPTHNQSATNTAAPSPHSTTSRPRTLERYPFERPPAAATSREYRQPLTVRLSPLPLEPQVAESSSRRRLRSAEPSTEEPMAKRFRRESPETRGRPDNHSSPSSDSDMADTELDVGKHRPSQLAQSSAPPKKKRTRTLTTPHQSAVLHALLAQSRFPTTAMREEVGRSIGLSARKVQNQRQKARRPRSQSDTPSARPPQYGPFPSAAESVSHGGRGFDEHGIDHMSYVGQPSPDDIPVRLLGPGMPGAPVYPAQSYRQVRPPPISAPPTDLRFQSGFGFQRLPSPQPYSSPRMYPLPGVRPATSQPSNWRERDPSRTLPPLVATRPSSSTYGTQRMHSSGVPPYALSRAAPRSISPEPRFAHQPPEPTPRNLPPPFTLQPPPQWDEASYTPLPRPSSSAWSRPGSRSTRGRSTSPVALRREHMGGVPETSDAYYLAEHSHRLPSSSPRSMPPTSAPPSRSGRYDPVRATFVPFSTPTVSPALSPARTGGGGGKDKRTDKNPSPIHEDH